MCLDLVNLSQFLVFCYPSSPRTLIASFCLPCTSLASAMDHTVGNVMEVNSFLSMLLLGLSYSSCGCHAQEKLHICEWRYIARGYIYIYMYDNSCPVSSAVFSLRICYDSWWFGLFIFQILWSIVKKILLTMLCYSNFFSFVIRYYFQLDKLIIGFHLWLQL